MKDKTPYRKAQTKEPPPQRWLMVYRVNIGSPEHNAIIRVCDIADMKYQEFIKNAVESYLETVHTLVYTTEKEKHEENDIKAKV